MTPYLAPEKIDEALFDLAANTPADALSEAEREFYLATTGATLAALTHAEIPNVKEMYRRHVEKQDLKEALASAERARAEIDQRRAQESLAAQAEPLRRELQIEIALERAENKLKTVTDESRAVLAAEKEKTRATREHLQKLLAELDDVGQQLILSGQVISRAGRKLFDAAVEVEQLRYAKSNLGKSPDERVGIATFDVLASQTWDEIGGRDPDLRAVPDNFPRELIAIIRKRKRGGLGMFIYSPQIGMRAFVR